jgi:hypothetical protein
MTNVRLRVPLVAIVLAALALYVFGKWTATQGLEDQGIIRAAEHAIATGKAWRARSARLAAIARASADSARRWKAKAIVAAPVAAQLDTALAQAQTMRDSNTVLTHQTAFYQGQAQLWEASARGFERAWLADSTRADDAEARVAELERHLASVLTVADCRVLNLRFMPRCPGRTTAFFLGAGVTAVAFVATRR